VEAALAARESEGAFKSLAEFCKRTQGTQVNKKVLESLMKCGAFDFTGASRRQLLEGLDRAMQWGASHARDDGNQIGLFAAEAIAAPEPTLPDVMPWPDRKMLKAEREALGFYITAHPLDKYERDLRRFTTGAIETLRGRENQTKVAVGGVIQSLRLRNNKKGDRYASFTLEDKSGTVEVICWPEMYKRTDIDLTTDEPVCVSGTLEVGEERWQVIADSVDLLTRARERTVQQVHFALFAERVDEERLRVLRRTLADHRGQCPAFLHLLLPNRTETIIALPEELRVAPTEGMVDAVEQLFGRGVASFQ
jgi:DNA polymerase-3 subunit alpha